VIAIVGGIRHPAGAFIGAIFFVLLEIFAIDIVGAERFNTLIGGLFLVVVLFSPDGLLGLWERARHALQRERTPQS
jgi:branched-chain amino acid transport system permease protein